MSRVITPEVPRLVRPRAVTLVAILHLIQGVALLAIGAVLVLGPAALAGWVGQDATSLDLVEMAAFGIVLLLFGLVAFTVALGLLRMRPWAWLLAMTLQGLGLATALTAHVSGDPDDLTMILGIFIVLSLNQREVRGAFERQGKRGD